MIPISFSTQTVQSSTDSPSSTEPQPSTDTPSTTDEPPPGDTPQGGASPTSVPSSSAIPPFILLVDGSAAAGRAQYVYASGIDPTDDNPMPNAGLLSLTDDQSAATTFTIDLTTGDLATVNDQWYIVIDSEPQVPGCSEPGVWSESLIATGQSDTFYYFQCDVSDNGDIDCSTGYSQIELFWDGTNIYQYHHDGESCDLNPGMTAISLLVQTVQSSTDASSSSEPSTDPSSTTDSPPPDPSPSTDSSSSVDGPPFLLLLDTGDTDSEPQYVYATGVTVTDDPAGPESGVFALTSDQTAAIILNIDPNTQYLGTTNSQFFVIVDQDDGSNVCHALEIWSESLIQRSPDTWYVQCVILDNNDLACSIPDVGQIQMFWDGGNIYQDYDGQACTAAGMTQVTLMVDTSDGTASSNQPGGDTSS